MSTEIPPPSSQHYPPQLGFFPSRKHMKVTDLTVQVPSSRPSEDLRKPSKWATNEYRFYLVILIIALPVMAWVPMSLSTSMSVGLATSYDQPRTIMLTV
jgi:hypothetical protein